MVGILKAIKILFYTLYTQCFLIIQSYLTSILSLFKPSRLKFENPYNGQKIVLVAMYQKGKLRRDVISLLKACKAYGAYVIAVNTKKLDDSVSYNHLMDCYIERFNFGRDFGSYKSGFLHIYNREWDKTCARLLMVNDSVFYLESKLPNFIKDMMEHDAEFLGATENYEMQYHLGSFCISMSNYILKHKLIRKFWRNFRLSDVRPKVIKTGEMGLSKIAIKCVGQANIQALYGTSAFYDEAQNNSDFLDKYIELHRKSKLVGWKRFSLKAVFVKIASTYFMELYKSERSLNRTYDFNVDGEFLPVPTEIIRKSEQEKPALTKSINHLYKKRNPEETQVDSGRVSGLYLTSTKQLEILLKQISGSENINNSLDSELLYREILSHALEVFMCGSQVHQNAAFLLHWGLPFVKLDGMYRGMFSSDDIGEICSQAGKNEAGALSKELLLRPFGGNCHKGWRRRAFYIGWI